MARFGIEEEFVLLDEKTLVPLAMTPQSRARLVGTRPSGEVTPEYLTCQLETATAPLATRADGAQQLREMREMLGAQAAEHGAIIAPTGTPFIAPHRFVVSRSPHYDAVADHLAEITRDHEVNGLHVHVEVTDDEERVRALNRVRPWLPVLLALTGNAPFSKGRPTGFASWRSILIRRLPASWSPPRFADLADYRARVDELVSMGAIPEASSIGWTVRLSENFPTVEVRVCDVQLTVDDTLLAVALIRALVLSDELGDAADVRHDAIDSSLWTAAQQGPDARIVDPRTGDVCAVQDVLAGMLERIAPTLEQHGDREFVSDALARISADGTGAQRQLRAHAKRGVAGLRHLYRAGSTGAGLRAAEN